MNKNQNLERDIIRYQRGLISKRVILPKITPLILEMPGFFNCFSKDMRHDFFLYVTGELDKILPKYQVQSDCRFETWFSVVLKYRFIRFYGQSKKKLPLHIIPVNQEVMEKAFYSEVNVEDVKTTRFDYLSKKESKIIQYKYGVNCSSAIIAEGTVSQLNKKRSIEERLNLHYRTLLELQNQLCQPLDENERLKLKQKEREIRFKKRKLESLYRRNNVLPTNGWVARELNIATSTVATYIRRIRQKIIRHSKDD